MTTQLDFLREAAFQQWYRNWAQTIGLNPNPDDPRQQYDYRGAFLSGITPKPDPYDNNRLHWPDRGPNGEWLKAQDHPTRWKQQYMDLSGGVNPDSLGLPSGQAGDRHLLSRQYSELPMTLPVGGKGGGK